MAYEQPQGAAQGPRTIEVSSASPAANPQLAALIAEIRQQADAFVFVSGGAAKMGEQHQRQLFAMFDALATVAKARRIAVGDGGTKAGVMEAAGKAREKSGWAFPLVGVAPAQGIPPRGHTPVDPNHSHIVAVDNPAGSTGEPWGSETATMYWLFGRLAENRPSVTVVANGGGIVLDEVDANVRAGRPMILIADSGRAASALVASLRGVKSPDADAASLQSKVESANLLRRRDLFRVVELSDGAEGLRKAIEDALRAAR